MNPFIDGWNRALTAASDAATPAGANAEDKGVSLQQGLQDFLDGDDHSPTAFRKVLRKTLQTSLEKDAAAFASALEGRGFSPATDTDQQLAVRSAITNTDDILSRLLEAYNNKTDVLTAGLSLPGFLSPERLSNLASSISQHVKDLIEKRVIKREVESESGFTGRRRFNSDPQSKRHGILNNVIAGPDEEFHLPQRVIGNRRLPAISFSTPRSDPSNTKEWSNSTVFLTYEHIDSRGRVSWK